MNVRIWIVLALATSVAWAESTYVVKTGDRLLDSCRTHDVSLDEVVRLNGIKDADLILPGQVIRLPEAGAESGMPTAQTDSGSNQRLSTSSTLPFVNYGSVSSNLRGVSRVKIAEEVMEKLQQAPPGAAGGFQMAAQLGEIMLRAPTEDKALVGGMLALIMTPYTATLASTLGTMPTLSMDAVFPAAQAGITAVIKTTLTVYGRVGAVADAVNETQSTVNAFLDAGNAAESTVNAFLNAGR